MQKLYVPRSRLMAMKLFVGVSRPLLTFYLIFPPSYHSNPSSSFLSSALRILNARLIFAFPVLQLLMTTAMGLSIGGVFWMKDFDKQPLNATPQTTSLKIKVPHGPRLDIWGSWLCVWAFHLILLSLTIQIDTGHKYRVIRWGFYLVRHPHTHKYLFLLLKP